MLGSAVGGACSLSRPFTGGTSGRTSSGNSSTSGGHSNNGSFFADFGSVASSSSSSLRLLSSSRTSRKCMDLRRASLGGPRATANTEKIETPASAPAAIETGGAKLDRFHAVLGPKDPNSDSSISC